MFPLAGKEFLVWIQFFWPSLFEGQYLLLTNTMSGGGLLALGDFLQQSWEIRKDPDRVQDWRRTGEQRCHPVGVKQTLRPHPRGKTGHRVGTKQDINQGTDRWFEMDGWERGVYPL